MFANCQSHTYVTDLQKTSSAPNLTQPEVRGLCIREADQSHVSLGGADVKLLRESLHEVQHGRPVGSRVSQC